MCNVGMCFDSAWQHQAPARVDPPGSARDAFRDGRDPAVRYSDICFERIRSSGYRAIMNNCVKIHLWFLWRSCSVNAVTVSLNRVRPDVHTILSSRQRRDWKRV